MASSRCEGHSSFGLGMPEITIPQCGGTLDPTNPDTYAMLRGFLASRNQFVGSRESGSRTLMGYSISVLSGRLPATF